MAVAQYTSLLQTFADLVAFQTVDGYPEQKNACFDYIENRLAKTGLVITRQVHDTEPSIVAITKPTKRPKVLLQSHIDVVPADLKMFKLTKSGTRLVGRGTFDMKFAAACYIQLADELSDILGDLDFGIMFSADEELGGENGVMQLVEQGFGADVCVLPDGGGDWKIEKTCNGAWFLKLIASGETAHGSRPWEGTNAIDVLLGAVSDIKRLFGHAHPENCSLTISQINGGSAINQVPDKAEVTLDMRFIDDEHYQRKRPKIEAIVAEHGLSLETVAQVDPSQTNMKHPLILSFIQIASEISGKEIEQTRSFGSSDSRYFNEVNVPCILLRPSGGGQHSNHEWIDEKEFYQFYEVIKAYILEVASSS